MQQNYSRSMALDHLNFEGLNMSPVKTKLNYHFENVGQFKIAFIIFISSLTFLSIVKPV